MKSSLHAAVNKTRRVINTKGSFWNSSIVLPHEYAKVPHEEHIHYVLILMSNFKPIGFANNSMPMRSISSVHVFFYDFCCHLQMLRQTNGDFIAY